MSRLLIQKVIGVLGIEGGAVFEDAFIDVKTAVVVGKVGAELRVAGTEEDEDTGLVDQVFAEVFTGHRFWRRA